jgi:hypothetical protein
MSTALWRLILAALLFFAWVGWLAYLSTTAARPVVLSRPQFLVSNLDVIAEVASVDSPEVRVREVHWPQTEQASLLINKAISVKNLTECREDWTGPGLYILPLMSDSRDEYVIAPIPRSPTFPGPGTREGRPRIYPDTPHTRAQLNKIAKLPALDLAN